MRQLVFAVLVGSLFIGATAQAIDAWQKIAQERPEDIDLSATSSSSGGYFSATYTLETDCAPLNSIHSWELVLVARDGSPLGGAEIDVSADMPEHLHGMTTTPRAAETATPGQYLIEGMNFHMPGWWVVTLDVSRGGGRDLARFNVLVGEGYCHP